MKKHLVSLLCVLIPLLCCNLVYPASFNKQRIRSFDWKIVSTEHFDIHYYEDAEPLVPYAMEYVEKSYQKFIRFYNIPSPKERVPFFLFAKHNEFEQTNIVDIGEGTGGVTEAFKNRLSVFNNGSKLWLEYVITHEMGHIIQFYILYGGFWKSVRLLKSFFYPLWMMEGLAEYGTGDIDKTERDMYIRDAATSAGLIPLQHLHNFSHLKPHQVTLAYKEAEMAIRFLADEYGIDKVKKILQTFKRRFDPHSVLSELIGMDLFRFNKKFIERLEEEYAYLSEGMDEPTVYGRQLTVSDNIPQFNTNPVFSPDGKEIAYISDWKGYPEIYLYHLEKDTRELLVGYETDLFENMSREGCAVSFSPEGRYIAFAAEYKQNDFIFIYDRETKSFVHYSIPLDQVSSPVFSPDGTTIAFVGMNNSITDIYLIDREDKKIRQLTHDDRDDNYPAFSADGETIIYSTEVKVSHRRREYERDLYQIDIASGDSEPLFSMPGNEESPAVSPDGRRVYFVNDQHDVRDIYYYDLTSSTTHQLTRVIGGNFTPAVSPDGKTLVFSSFRKGNMHLYYADKSTIPQLNLSKEEEQKIFFADLDSGLTVQYTITVSTEGTPTPYRFSASTDLFFPILFYSSLDGLFAQLYWQASEMLGNHQVTANVGYASGDDFLDYNFMYAFLKYKPRIFIGAAGENYYRDFDQTDRRTEHVQFAGVQYPLNRFNRIEFQSGTVARSARFRSLDNFKIRDRENFVSTSFVRDITTGRYLEPNRGYRFRMTYEQSNEDIFNSDYDYRNHVFEGSYYVPLYRSTLAFRALGGVSFGKTPGYFRLGGVDRMRGFSRGSEAYKSPRAILVNAEWRIPLSLLNYYVWYLFPDLFFKQMVGVVFTDSGFLWRKGEEFRSVKASDINNSVGIGIRFYTFILQTFRLDLSFDFAKRTSDGSYIFYFSLGPEF